MLAVKFIIDLYKKKVIQYYVIAWDLSTCEGLLKRAGGELFFVL